MSQRNLGLADTYWRSLRYFNYYRLIVGVVLVLVGLPTDGYLHVELADRGLFSVVCWLYLGLAAVSLVVVRRWRKRFHTQLTVQVLADVLAITLLVQASGGLRGGFGVLIFASLAAASLVGRGRLVLFYAAVAALAVLFQHSYQSLTLSESEQVSFFQAGLLSAGFFVTAVIGRLLASRVIATEELARQRGLDLQRQIEVSNQVIAQMHDGVVLVKQDGELGQLNPRAREFLGQPDGESVRALRLPLVAPGLAQAISEWRVGEAPDECEFRAPAGGRLVNARFVPVGEAGGETLVFLADVGRQREQAQQIKLAALGRLTANIAHEIRNPLSAIQHAAELVKEAPLGPEEDRLLSIVLDNTQRLERIVSDVLQVGRRDRVHREAIDLAAFVPVFVDEWVARNRLLAGNVDMQIVPTAGIEFDRSHLNQVLWNLLDNAHRHGRQQPGSVKVWLESADGAVRLHVADDGLGIAAELRAQVFEPFFTTHVKGTGLGLYIARELCEANGARLDLLDNCPGGHFCIVGGGSKW